jgi:hypothetical protein
VVDWVERVTKLRQWTRHGERAAHKLLLLLYALGHFQRYGDTPISFSECLAGPSGRVCYPSLGGQNGGQNAARGGCPVLSVASES